MMVTFNFQIEFAEPILTGTKIQTIRQKARCKPGDPMSLFVGMRTKSCRRLMDTRCAVTDYVHIAPDGLTLGDVRKHPRDIDEFARLDGFRDFADMLAWFTARYGTAHFIGHVHRCTTPTDSAGLAGG